MTFGKDRASNLCKTKETLFEDFLHKQFKDLEQDYDGVDRVLDKFKSEQEPNGTITKEDTERTSS